MAEKKSAPAVLVSILTDLNLQRVPTCLCKRKSKKKKKKTTALKPALTVALRQHLPFRLPAGTSSRLATVALSPGGA